MRGRSEEEEKVVQRGREGGEGLEPKYKPKEVEEEVNEEKNNSSKEEKEDEGKQI